jgi:hypothetical protein
MGGSPRPIRRITTRQVNHLSLERLGAKHGIVEVVDLKPESNPVAVRARRSIADPAVMVLDAEGVQLHHQLSLAEQALVLLAAMPTLAAQQFLVEGTAARHIGA